MLECLEKRSCTSSIFPIAILNGTCFFSDSATTKAHAIARPFGLIYFLPTLFFAYSLFSACLLLSLFVIFHSCYSHAQVLGIILMQDFYIFTKLY